MMSVRDSFITGKIVEANQYTDEKWVCVIEKLGKPLIQAVAHSEWDAICRAKSKQVNG